MRIPRTSLLAAPLLLLLACGDSNGSSTTTGTGGSSSTTTGSTTSGTGGTGGIADAPLVTTDKGPVKGTTIGATFTFLGVPYAAPPVGDLRWKPPQPAKAWTEALDATKKGPFCPQLSALGTSPMAGTSEDCLSLNIWTPSIGADKKAPVLFWIHGGGFILGSGAEATYDGQLLSEATGAVVVTINYRLGPLGFLAHAALAAEDAGHPSSGMYGFEDQRAALAWAKANIGAFGGDPSNITLFGESAGGISTCLHLLSPPSKGLFQRAIIESGPCSVGTGATEKQAEVQGDALAQALGCSDPATALACLRGKKADDLLTALPGKKGLIAGDGVNWFPVVDGVNIPDQPSTLLDQGKVEKVPVILGTNGDEGTLFFAIGATAKDDAEYEALMSSIFGGQGAAIVAHYPSAMYGTAKDAAAKAFGDGAFVCPTRRTARALAKAGVDAHLYHFVHAPKALFPNLGAFHSSEVPFIFGNPYLGINLDAEEQKLSKAMVGYWSRLAASGDPNGKDALAWPAYDAAGDQNIVLDLMLSTQSGLSKDDCDFWDGILP
ncbi:MAG: carboxylesterase/lipase family protein [Byssovorax sp.]